MEKDLNKEIQILANKYQAGEFQDVLKKSSVLLKNNSKNDILWNLSGLAFQQIGNIKKSILSFQKAIEVNPKNYAAKNNLAISLKNNKEYAEAENILNKLLEINPNYLNALVNLANLKNDTYFFDEAIKLYKKVLIIKSDMPQIYVNIAHILQTQNKIEDAKEILNKALKIDKNFTRADELLSRLNNYNDSESKSHLDEMLVKLEKKELNNDQKIRLHFSLGKAYEDKKDFEKSFHYLQIANNLSEKRSKSSIKFYKKKAEVLKKIFSKLNLKNINKFKDDGKKIFILGLPRSGTTLLERIISSHPKVSSISEAGIVFDEITKNIVSNGSVDENEVSNYIKLDFNKRYMKIANNFNIQSEFIIDKTLLNFWYVGFLKIFFPNSKIIHSFRNPKDNCLSIYKNLFPTNEKWPYDQMEMSEYYLIYYDLMKFWNKLFKNQIYNSKYEDLVNDKEKYIKDIINFCELKWDDKCLKHYENNNPIKTLSINQANKPIYKSSVNSSKFFEKKMSKLFETLDNLN